MISLLKSSLRLRIPLFRPLFESPTVLIGRKNYTYYFLDNEITTDKEFDNDWKEFVDNAVDMGCEEAPYFRKVRGRFE